MKKVKNTEKTVLKAVKIWSTLVLRIMFLGMIGFAAWHMKSIEPLILLLLLELVRVD